MTTAQKYASTQAETASKDRLMVLLFEAALRHMRVAATALEEKRNKDARAPLDKAFDIVTELLGTLDASKAPELCQQLTSVYVFVSERLIKAIASQDPAFVREAERAFAPIAEGFTQAVASLQAPTGDATAK